jgi:hypothetical protein
MSATSQQDQANPPPEGYLQIPTAEEKAWAFYRATHSMENAAAPGTRA